MHLQRFVDDFVTAIPNDHEHDLLKTFHSFDPKLLEKQIQRRKLSFSFVDVIWIRYTTDRIEKKMYAKSTCSDGCLNYDSNYLKMQKMVYYWIDGSWYFIYISRISQQNSWNSREHFTKE